MPMEVCRFSSLTEDYVFAHAIENKVDFLIRAKDLNVQRFLGVETLPDNLDTTVELILTRTQSKKKHKHSEKASQYRFIYKTQHSTILFPLIFTMNIRSN